MDFCPHGHVSLLDGLVNRSSQQTDASSRGGCDFWLVLSVIFQGVNNQDSWDPRFNKRNTTVKMRHVEGIPDKKGAQQRKVCLREGVGWISVKGFTAKALPWKMDI